MSLRFYRRVSIIPGLRVNLSKSGASVSVGHRGVSATFGSKGRRVTLGLPGSGLFWTERIPPAGPVSAAHRLNTLLVAIVIVVLLALTPCALSFTN